MIQQKLTDTPPKWFLIASHGWSASNWLAYTLNSHPEIVCAHSSAAIIASNPNEFNGDNLLEEFGLSGALEKLQKIRKGYGDRRNRALDAVYYDIERDNMSLMQGTVHTFRLRDLPYQALSINRLDKPILVANLIRHPIDLVNSGFGQFLLSFRFDLSDFQWTLKKIVDLGLDAVERLSIKHNIFPGDFENICFLGACLTLSSLKQDIDALPFVRSTRNIDYIGSIQKEIITNYPEILRELIARLSFGSILVNDVYLNQVFQTGAINRHNHDTINMNTQEVFGAWSEWQRDTFTEFFKKFELRSFYANEGYDLSMISSG